MCLLLVAASAKLNVERGFPAIESPVLKTADFKHAFGLDMA